MSIEVIYRVLKTNGELAGEYMDKKQADAHDQKLDCIYAICDLIGAAAAELDDSVIEQIAEHLVDHKTDVINAMKKVKDMPVDTGQTKSSPLPRNAAVESESNIETIDGGKRLANG